VPATTAPPTVTTTAPPPASTPVDPAVQRLTAIAEGDRPFVRTWLADSWVPQLSSKKPGTVDDGLVWNNSLILLEHLRLRQQYDARLLWSGNWSTFDKPDYWVTVANVTFPDPDGALAWCRDRGFDRDHCFAKLVSTTHGPGGSTKYP
jgi:serine/threonine-protein kinase